MKQFSVVVLISYEMFENLKKPRFILMGCSRFRSFWSPFSTNHLVPLHHSQIDSWICCFIAVFACHTHFLAETLNHFQFWKYGLNLICLFFGEANTSCYSFEDFSEKNEVKYENIPKLCDKLKVEKNLIKPIYLS